MKIFITRIIPTRIFSHGIFFYRIFFDFPENIVQLLDFQQPSSPPAQQTTNQQNHRKQYEIPQTDKATKHRATNHRPTTVQIYK
jgi:hypothetical protein